jgi:hypothetical protein
MIIVLLFIRVKSDYVFHREKPYIIHETVFREFEEGSGIDLQEENSNVAFRVIDSETGATLDDRTYVKWAATFVQENNLTGNIIN